MYAARTIDPLPLTPQKHSHETSDERTGGATGQE
jgi:hypothetical protein